MVKFIAGVLEQLDVALEHISKGDIHNARFRLMMTDNALELTLHRFAGDKLGELKAWDRKWDAYPHRDELLAAQGQHFDRKVKFAHTEGMISTEDKATVLSLHGFRNQLYHAGLQHEQVLPSLSAFYLDVVCRILADYRVSHWSHGSKTSVPDRARKYISTSSRTGRLMPNGEDFNRGCSDIRDRLDFDHVAMIASIADYLDEIIEMFDYCVQMAADGPYNDTKVSRDQAIIGAQAWRAIFSDEGRAFIKKHVRPQNMNNVADLERWMEDHFPMKVRADPVASWESRAKKIRSGRNPHSALSSYLNFMKETEPLRGIMQETAGQVEAEIDRIIDERRGR